jgi:hypothetical protein
MNIHKQLLKALKARRAQRRKIKAIERAPDMYIKGAINPVDTANAALAIHDDEIERLCRVLVNQVDQQREGA